MRKVEFLGDDGSWSSKNSRKHVHQLELAEAWRRYTSKIPIKYALGTAVHESDLTLNERDTEDSSYQSFGVFQLGDEERRQVGLPNADLMSLDGSCAVLAKLAEYRLNRIVEVAGISEPYPQDVWFYLAAAHNLGLGAALKSIRLHGLDAEAWTRRNSSNPDLAKAARYYADCV